VTVLKILVWVLEWAASILLLVRVVGHRVVRLSTLVVCLCRSRWWEGGGRGRVPVSMVLV
jgi:hypothetical protein